MVHLARFVSSVCRSSGSVVVLSDSKRVLLAGQPTSANLIIALGVRSILFLRSLTRGLIISVGPPLLKLLVGVCITLDVPGVVNHQSKVFIVFDRYRDIVVVLEELFESDPVVSRVANAYSMMNFEGLDEIHQHLLF